MGELVMLLLNFSHPLTPAQLEQVHNLTNQKVDQVFNIFPQFDVGQPFQPQLNSLMTQIPLTSDQLQTQPILVNPPALNFIAVLVLAELHGRMGYFPPILRLRPASNALPPVFEVAEILNLQIVRDQARAKRFN